MPNDDRFSAVVDEISQDRVNVADLETVRHFSDDEELHANCCGRDTIEEKRNRLDVSANFLENSLFLK